MSGERPKPVDALKIPRFAGPLTFARLPYREDLAGVDLAVLGVPFDGGTTFRPGPRFGPRKVREASVLLRTYNPALRVNPFDLVSVVDGGDLPVVPTYLEDTFARVEAALKPILELGVVPLCIGGDHSVTLPILRAVAARHGPVALVHIDAHTDLWDEYYGRRYSHGTTFRRALEEGLIRPEASVQVGMHGPVFDAEDYELPRRLGLLMVPLTEIDAYGIDEAVRVIRRRVQGPTYLSFDIDVVDPAFAPGTGTPEAGGLTPREVLRLVRGLAGLPFVGFDLVEVSPPYDQGDITALLAANIAYEFICLAALGRQPERTEA